MKKKIITTSLLGFMAFSATPVLATEAIAFSLNVYPTCTGCHTNANLSTADKGNLKAAAKTAYNQDKRTLSGINRPAASSGVFSVDPLRGLKLVISIMRHKWLGINPPEIKNIFSRYIDTRFNVYLATSVESC
jgi:hypothetical protein